MNTPPKANEYTSYNATKKIEIISDKNNKILIEMTILNSKLYIAGKHLTTEQYPNKKFEKYYSLDDIKNINNFFYSYKEMEEILDEIDYFIQLKTPKVNEETNKMILSIEIPSKKFKEIIFQLNLTKKSNEEHISDLYELLNIDIDEVKGIKKENEKLKETNKLLKDKVEEQEKELKQLKELINTLSNKINENKEEYNKNLNDFNQNNEQKINELSQKINEINNNNQNEEKDESKIKIIINSIFKLNLPLADKNEMEFIKNAIENKLNQKVKQFTVIYRATLMGGEMRDIHKYIDDKANTILLVRSNNGKKFGGFTTQTWDSKNHYKKDDKAFVFSINSKEIFSVKANNVAIGCFKDYGPIFGDDADIYFWNSNMFTTSFSSNQRNYEYNGKNNALTGNTNFIAQEIEMLKVEFD